MKTRKELESIQEDFRSYYLEAGHNDQEHYMKKFNVTKKEYEKLLHGKYSLINREYIKPANDKTGFLGEIK